MCSSDTLCMLSITYTRGWQWETLNRELCIFHVVSIAVGVIWLRHLSPTDGQDFFGLLGYPLLPVIPCAVLIWSVERDIQSLAAPKEHDCETLASTLAALSAEISSLRKRNKWKNGSLEIGSEISGHLFLSLLADSCFIIVLFVWVLCFANI